MRVVELDHIVLNVTDVERSLQWWTDLLGMEGVRVDEWRAGTAPFVSVRVNADTIIDLQTAERTGENMNHVALVVEDVDLDALVADERFAIERGPRDLFGARGIGRGVYLRDPDGNGVELRTS